MDNRRAHPRLVFEQQDSAEHSDDKKAPILDISRGGACFVFIHEYITGDNINIRIGNLNMTMEVLDSRLMEIERDLVDFRYKTRCRHVGGDAMDIEPYCEVITP